MSQTDLSVPQIFVPSLKALVRDLVNKNYHVLEADGRAGRMPAEIIEEVIQRYGRTLVELPDAAYANEEILYIEKIEGRDNEWDMNLALWTKEEGRSDLTLTLQASIKDQEVVLQMMDLHVL